MYENKTKIQKKLFEWAEGEGNERTNERYAGYQYASVYLVSIVSMGV